MKDAFDSYMDMILSSTIESIESEDDLSDFVNSNVGEDLDIYRDVFTSKEDFTEIDEDVKYSWRENYDYDFDYNINPKDYETEEEYLEALEEAHISTDGHTETTKSKIELNTNNDKSNIYSYCKVFLKSSNKQSYYLSENFKLNLGDVVLLPSDHNNIHEIGTVIAVGECFGYAFPCDVNKIKPVIKLLNKTDITKESRDTSKEKSNSDDLIYEDNYIKISLAKWIHKSYLVGGEARTGTFIFENKYDKRFCIYFKDISIDGFLNQTESFTVALSGKQKELKEMPFVYNNRIPDGSKEYRTIEFKVCYGTIKDGMNSIHLINKPVIESDIISIKV